MTQDATRRPGQEPQRHAVGITRTCLASGTMQLPFALSGAFPQGEVLVHDAEAGEPVVLWSEPPRRLAGLAPFFERHDLHVNDAVVLEIDGDTIRMTASKRPRRSRPVVQPSTWTSVHDDAPETARTPEPDAPPPAPEAGSPPRHDGERHADADQGEGAQADERPRRRFELGPDRYEADVDRLAFAERDGDDDGDMPWTASSADDVAPDEPHEAHRHDTPGGTSEPTQMPSAPRVTVTPADDAASGRPLPTSASMPERRGPFAGLRRLTRSLFGGGDAGERRSGREDPAEGPDWTRAWDADEQEDEPTPGFAPGDASRRASFDDAASDDDLLEDLLDEPPPTASTGAAAMGRHREDLDHDAPQAAEELADAADRADAPVEAPDVAPVVDPPEEVEDLGPTPLFPEAAPPRGPVRRPVDETPSGVPPRAERFLGGDLRTRLLRYLASPEMGAVAKVERIAKRFDLDEATAASMLADIADDPPDGLRLRSVREGAWRIERTLGR